MHINEFDKILVIISTASTNYRQVEKKIKNKLSSLVDSNKFTILLTKDKSSIKNFSKEFSTNNPGQLLIVVGGDGSLGEAVNAIYGRDVIFSFLPNGTGNDFSKSIYSESNFDKILNKIEKISFEDVDIIKVNDEYSLNVFAFGFESLILAKSLEIKPKLGRFKGLSFVFAVFSLLTKLKSYQYKFELKLADGKLIKGHADRYLTAICNGLYYGNGFMPAPEAKINDGILNLNSLNKDKFLKLLHFFIKYRSNKHMSLDVSINQKVLSGKFISTCGPIPGNLDGNFTYFERIEFNVVEKAIKLGKFVG